MPLRGGAGGINAYNYAGNDPINSSDPTGHYTENDVNDVNKTMKAENKQLYDNYNKSKVEKIFAICLAVVGLLMAIVIPGPGDLIESAVLTALVNVVFFTAIGVATTVVAKATENYVLEQKGLKPSQSIGDLMSTTSFWEGVGIDAGAMVGGEMVGLIINKVVSKIARSIAKKAAEEVAGEAAGAAGEAAGAAGEAAGATGEATGEAAGETAGEAAGREAAGGRGEAGAAAGGAAGGREAAAGGEAAGGREAAAGGEAGVPHDLILDDSELIAEGEHYNIYQTQGNRVFKELHLGKKDILYKPTRTSRLLKEQNVDALAYKNGVLMPHFDVETDEARALAHAQAYTEKTGRSVWSRDPSEFSTTGKLLNPTHTHRPDSPTNILNNY